MEYIGGMTKYFWKKIWLSIPACFFTLDQSQVEIIYAIIFIVIIDTILGLSVAIKFKRLSSWKMGRAFSKVGKYGLAMASVWVISAAEPEVFGWSFNWMGIFIILTEIISNFEKLALLGMKMPTKLMARLNEEYKKYFLGEKTPEEIIDNR